MDFESLNNNVVLAYKFVFFIFGTVGNVLFIHLIYKKKQLRSRSSILQCAQCVFHIICLFGTVVDSFFIFDSTLTRRKCFTHIFFYIFCQAAQGLIMLFIMLDFLVMIRFPMFYRNISNSIYFGLTCIPIISYSLFVVSFGYFTTTEEQIHACNPLFAFSVTSSLVLKCLILILCSITMIIYIILIRMFHRKDRTPNCDSLKIMRRLQFSVVIFIFTWLFSQIIALIFLRDGAMVKSERMIFAHNSLFIVLSYSNTFYVTIWRSEEYRKQFFRIWRKNRAPLSTRPNTLPSF
ncbi:hypothetical protein CAEBREN_23690 [Caenorhabditis brenneri]|uniref:G-protein coupled receptors family 1 profile domain-containing protein n=1 Tax=Caenorhabditis brenneri TaxID=135651 RepID=G0MS43_CAEBE|nr:hypothetical protein CAEBREN_23690 [Caenorhabditis brenneri]